MHPQTMRAETRFFGKGGENLFTFRGGCAIMLSGLICDPIQIDK